MKYFLITLGVIGVVAFMISSYFANAYNALVVQNTAVDGQWAQVETQYQRRFDLIPGLVESVRGTMGNEQAVFGAIADARTHYANAKTTNDKVQAANQYEGSLARLMVVMENYPVLQSNQQVKALMDELAGTENRIAVSRDRFNNSVLEYNTYLKRFPTNVIAGMFGFQSRDFFKSEQSADKAVKFDLTVKHNG